MSEMNDPILIERCLLEQCTAGRKSRALKLRSALAIETTVSARWPSRSRSKFFRPDSEADLVSSVFILELSSAATVTPPAPPDARIIALKDRIRKNGNHLCGAMRPAASRRKTANTERRNLRFHDSGSAVDLSASAPGSQARQCGERYVMQAPSLTITSRFKLERPNCEATGPKMRLNSAAFFASNSAVRCPLAARSS
jgi:hypothetical protein